LNEATTHLSVAILVSQCDRKECLTPDSTGRTRRIWRYKLSEVDATVVSGAHKDGALARKSSPPYNASRQSRSSRKGS
jgi:hypothetical protein